MAIMFVYSRLVRCVFPGADSHSTKGMRARMLPTHIISYVPFIFFMCIVFMGGIDKMHIYETRFRAEEDKRASLLHRSEMEEEERRIEDAARRDDRSGLSALSPPSSPLPPSQPSWKRGSHTAASSSSTTTNTRARPATSSAVTSVVPSNMSVRDGLQSASLAIQNEHDLSLTEGGRTHLYSLALRKVHDRHRHARTTASFFVDERRRQHRATTATAATATTSSLPVV